MRALRLHRYGERPVLEQVGEPEVTDALDVVVRIGGAGLCRTDLHIVEGQWRQKSGVTLPYTLGHENAGWVHEVGGAVTNVAPGDAVVVHPLVTCGLCRACRAGDDMHCVAGRFPGITADGGFAELLKTNARALVRLPSQVEPQDVAAHADAGLSAYHAVKKAAKLLYPGATVVVIGAGGLGHIGIQSLKVLTAARVVVVDRSEDSLELARECGADDVVLADGGQVEAVAERTEGLGAEAVIDFVGEGGALEDSLAMLSEGGTHYVVGYGDTLSVAAIDLISAEINVVGNLVGTYNELAELMALEAEGKVGLHTSTYPLEAADEAIDDLDAGRLHGRGILVP